MEPSYQQEIVSNTKHINLHSKIIIPMDTQDILHFGSISDIFRKIMESSGLTDADPDPDQDPDPDIYSDTETLPDILDILEEDDYLCVAEYIHELCEYYIDTHFLTQSSPTFIEDMVVFVSGVLFDVWEDYGFSIEETSEKELKLWVQNEIEAFMENLQHWIPPRQGKSCFASLEKSERNLAEKIEKLMAVPMQEQRSQEWYNQRNNLLTASNIWKVFSTQAQYNSLIVEKCKPTVENAEAMRSISSSSSLHWGILFEPITAQIYCMKNITQLGEFGCIVHPRYSFLGASPDGINIDPSSPLYGRMIEIKNVVSRQINGIPLEAYWIQMQLQMEICDLEECDFIETKFAKITREEWIAEDVDLQVGIILRVGPRIFVPFSEIEPDDATIEYDGDSDTRKVVYADTAQYKQDPFYVYVPFDISRESQEIWVQNYRLNNPGLVVMEIIYWKLEYYSCIFVHRNREWFQAALPKIEECWKIVEYERIHGYQHRLSAKKKMTEVIHTDTMCSVQMPAKSSVCLVKLDY